MKNSIIELTNYENVAGGMACDTNWGLPWNAMYFFTSALVFYNFKSLNTYNAIVNYNKSNNLESIGNIAVGFSKDLYNYSTCAFGIDKFINDFIPYVVIKVSLNSKKMN